MTVPSPGESSAEAGSPLNYLQAIDLQPSVLTGSAVFTSAAIDLGSLRQRIGSFARWRVFTWSDQAGSCALQQSPDGATFYPTQVNAYAAGGQAAIYESLVALEFLRVVYTNGAVSQTQFRLLATLVAV